MLRLSLANHEPVAEAGDDAIPAGVLIPLQYHNDDWHVILNVRSEHVTQHQGEIAFPGGRLESEDKDMTACALRECWEEMGVSPRDVDVLGSMSGRLTRTNFIVWPTVGVIPYPYDFKPASREVAEIIEISLGTLLDGSADRHEARLESNGDLIRRMAYGLGEHLVFGATAWILTDLLDIIDGLGPESQHKSEPE